MMASKSMFAGIACCVATVSCAVEPWEDPAVNEINRLPARAFSVPCETEELALAVAQGTRPKSASRWIRSLNGEWDFGWKSATSVAEWEKSAKIAVPGCWQLQGEYDPAQYTNVPYPIEPDAPRVRKEPKNKEWTSCRYRDPVGLYTTTFTRPWRWWFRRTILRFDGVSSAFYVRVNGKDVGYAEDSRLPSEFDISPYLKVFGRNTLEVEVHKYSDGTYLEDQDFWRLSGVFRGVCLVSEEKDAPFDLVVETKLSDDLKSGSFVVRDEKGAVLKSRDVTDVKLWSAEYPYVYVTPIENRRRWWFFGGTDYRAVTFGFRKVEIRDSVLYLNGKRVLFKGTNRHEMKPSTGYAITSEDMRKDIAVMKSFNINAVRTCHYPDDPEWYDLCDREGLMTVCEANIESHGYNIYTGTNSLSFRGDYSKSHIERNVRMVATYRNHPSILVWSMGNEAGYGPNFKPAYKAMRALDSTRPIQYENYCDLRLCEVDRQLLAGDESSYTDIECPMYPKPWTVESYLKAPKKPLVLCEYTHAMGNSNGGIQEYWDLVGKYPSFQGGFIWDFMDQALWKSDARTAERSETAEGRKWLAYGGDFGDRPNDSNFNCNGFFDALRNPHPGAYEVKHAYQSVRVTAFDFATGTAKVRNEFLFIPLEDHVCLWQSLKSDGTLAAKGEFEFGGLSPGAEGSFVLKNFGGDSVVFTVLDGEGRTIAWDSFARPFVPREVKVKDEGERRTDSALAADLGLRLNFWRAPTDNDRGWKMPEGVKSDLKTSKTDNGATLVDWTLTVPKGLPPIPRVGLSFTVPKTDKVEYFGLGPWENYSDRATSAMLGVYQASVGLVSGLADPKTGTIAYPEDRLNPDNYIRPGEQGYRTGCRCLKVGQMTIEAVNAPFGFNVWPYPQSMLEGKRHQWEMSEANELTVNVDAVQMGVGGDDSWGAKPHGQYLPGSGVYRLVFVIRR